MAGSRTASLLLALLIVVFLAPPGMAAAPNPANVRIALTAYSSSNWQCRGDHSEIERDPDTSAAGK